MVGSLTKLLLKTKRYDIFDINLAFICVRLSFISYYEPKKQINLLTKYGFQNIKLIKKQNAHATLVCYNDDLFVAIRGTDFTNGKDIRNDFDMLWSEESYGFVHAGYKSHLDLIWVDILNYISSHKYKRIIFTGHSMGGACGQIANCRIPNTMGYYFGSPRCVDKQTKNNNKSIVFNIQHKYDIVPGIPPKIFGFELLGNVMLIYKNKIVLERPKWYDRLHSISYSAIYFIIKMFGNKSKFVDLILINHKIYDYLTNFKSIMKVMDDNSWPANLR